MSGGIHRGVGKMKGWRANVVTVIIVLSLASCCTAAFNIAKTFRAATKSQAVRTAVKAYKGSEDVLTAVNAEVGIFTRSVGVGTAMQQMRNEGQDEISLSTQLAITTLAVSDIAGGVLLPVAQKIVDELIVNQLFKASKAAFKGNPDTPADVLKFLSDATYRNTEEGQNAVRNILVKKKVDLKSAMSTNLDDFLGKIGGKNTKILRKITKVKKLFKVAKFAKALGPVFDVINIGMSTYSLVTTAIDCHKDRDQCNVGGLVSASLGIISGVLGIISLAVPFLAPLALIVGIAASLVELFWTPPEPPLPDLHLEAKLFDLNADKMLKLDVYSRMQLQGVNSFLQQGGESIVDHYIYVVNQGHLPNWMEENIKEPEEMLSGPLTFGFNEKSQYDRYGIIYPGEIEVRGQCTNMSLPFTERSSSFAGGSNDKRCGYFQEGNGDLTVNSKYEQVGKNLYVGPDFYGMSQVPRHERNDDDWMYDNTDKSKYKGVMILVPTDRVTYVELRGEEGQETYTTPVRTRGLHIDTERKLRQQQQSGLTAQYDDVVAIGDMLNLGYKVEDGGHMVIINTGNTGRDTLVIDGWVNKLEARLGSNHNTLSFRTISRSIQESRRADNSKKQDEIKGIKFNPGSGQVIMYGNVEHDLGHVHGVGILGASPFDDEVTLFALQKDVIYDKYHFSVYKFMGKATYIFDAKNHKSQRFGTNEVVNFKVLDASKAVPDNPDIPVDCVHDDAPLLKIINMDNTAQEKDVQYRGNIVYIYSHLENDNRERIQYATITFVTKCPAKVSATSENGGSILQKEEKWMSELDIMFYEGTRYDHDFSHTPQNAESGDDIMYLSCPPNNVADDKAVRNVETLVVDDAFFDDCVIGTNDDEAPDGEDIAVTWEGDGTMRWKFPGNTDGDTEAIKNIAEQTFTGVTKIVNRYNREIVTLDKSTRFYLYTRFLEVSGQDIVKDSNLGVPVQDNLNMCILKVANLKNLKERQKRKTKKRKGTKRDTEAAAVVQADLDPDYDIAELKDSCWKAGEAPP